MGEINFIEQSEAMKILFLHVKVLSFILFLLKSVSYAED